MLTATSIMKNIIKINNALVVSFPWGMFVGEILDFGGEGRGGQILYFF